MSGAAALSAAKNRRGQSQSQQQTPNKNKVVSAQSCQPKGNVQQAPPTPMHPLQALQMHEIRLGQMEKKTVELQESINSLSSLAPTTPKKDSTTDNAIASHLRDMTKRIAQLEEMYHLLKEDIFRVQTFAMETNISFLKYKATDVTPVSAPVSVPVPVPSYASANIQQPQPVVEVVDLLPSSNLPENTSANINLNIIETHDLS